MARISLNPVTQADFLWSCSVIFFNILQDINTSAKKGVHGSKRRWSAVSHVMLKPHVSIFMCAVQSILIRDVLLHYEIASLSQVPTFHHACIYFTWSSAYFFLMQTQKKIFNRLLSWFDGGNDDETTWVT